MPVAYIHFGGRLQGFNLLAARASRFANAIMIVFSSGSLTSAAALAGICPLSDPLLAFWPRFTLALGEQRKDFHLASDKHAILVESLVIGEKANRLLSDFSAYASFLKRLARR